MEEFETWLKEELDKREWTPAILGRRAGLGNSTVNRILSGERKAGADVCSKIAKAFGYPPEEVFRLAGLLPAVFRNNGSDLIRKLTEITSQLPEAYQQDILDYAEWRYSQFLDEDPAESIKLLGDELERIFSLLNPGERATILSQAARDRRFRNMAQEIIRRKSL